MEQVLRRDTTDSLAVRLTEVGVPTGKIGTVGSAIELATLLELEPMVSCGAETCSQVGTMADGHKHDDEYNGPEQPVTDPSQSN